MIFLILYLIQLHTAISALNNTVQSDPAWFVRNKAIVPLANQSESKTLDLAKILDIDILITLLDDQNWTLVKNTIWALSTMGEQAEAALPKLINLAQTHPRIQVRLQAVEDIGIIGKAQTTENTHKSNEETVKGLIRLLQTDSNNEVRTKAAEALGNVDPYTASSRQELIKFLNDNNEQIRVTAAVGLSNLATLLQDKYQSSPKDTSQLSLAIKDLDDAIKQMKLVSQASWQDKKQKDKFQQQQDIITRRLNFLKQQDWQASWQAITSNEVFQVILVLIVLSVLYIVFYLILFLRFPLWLLKRDEAIWKTISEVHPVAKGIISLISSVLFLKYHPRVLDAWVEKYHKKVQDDFLHQPTVQHHKIYVPLAVQLNSGDDVTTTEQLTSQNLKEFFRRHLLIWGESGTGKTSIALQIARWAMSDKREERLCTHRMLPVLISENIEIDHSGAEKPFIAAIRGQLEAAIKEESISPELLEHLLREKRILVIVDHFSEMSEATRKLIHPEQPGFPAHALVVTSRQEESLGSVLVIQPAHLKGSQISVFLEAYIDKKGARTLFTDLELHNNCVRLSEIVGERNITPMFAKLYAEQLIDSKKKAAQNLTLPNNIPELMIKYLDELNREVKENPFEESIVDQDAESLAWACVKDRYYPSEIMRLDAIAALQGSDAEARLKYLEEKLHLIQRNQTSKDKISFVLEPLAEYLAAWHLIDLYGQDQEQWRKFLEQLDSLPRTFLIALRDCCEARAKDAHLPKFVTEKFNQVNGKSI